MVPHRKMYHRTSHRLKGHDYGAPGAYFITANCINREHLFGEIRNGEMSLNAFGRIVLKEWYKSETIRTNITLGAFIVMPDHLHGIIIIQEKRLPVNSIYFATADKSHRSLISVSQTLGAIMRGFMGTVTSQINRLRDTPDGVVWQRNYWDRIIRNEKAFQKISSYILNNPKKWKG